MKYASLGIICFVAFLPFQGYCQTTDSATNTAAISAKLSDKYINAIGIRSALYQDKMEKGTEKYLDKLKAQELVLQKQLSKINPEAATRIFDGSQLAYDNIQNDLKNNSEKVLKSCGKYVPGIDSAITSLKFLQQNGVISGKLASNAAQVKSAQEYKLSKYFCSTR
jgi:hypothetical protein